MSRKIPGSAIVPGTITVTQITGGLNDTTNASYAQANTARTTANDAYGQANTAYGQANNAYSSANLSYEQANASYNVANTKLASVGGTLSGDLIITGNLTVSGNSTTLNTEVLTVEDAEVVLLSNVAGTPALNAGIIVNRGTSTNTFLRWDEALDEWGWSDSGTTTYYFEDLRAGLATTNTTFGTVNTSLGTINTSYQAAYAQANTAHGTANDAYGQANTAYGQANSAYGAANNRVLKAGDTMTGQLNISSGGLLVTDNVGIGVTPSAWNSDYKALNIGSKGIVYGRVGSQETAIGTNWYRTTAAVFAYASNGFATFYIQDSGNHSWHIAPNNASGAGATASFTQPMTLTAAGKLGIGVTSPSGLLDVRGTAPYMYVVDSAGDNQAAFVAEATNTVVNIGSTYLGTAAVPLALVTGGTERARIDANGNFGIGTTNPLYHVMILRRAGSTITAPLLNLQCNSNVLDGDSFILYGTQTANWAAGVDQADSNKFRIEPSTTLGGTTGLTIDTSGNLGIGTTSPTAKVHIEGADGSSFLRIQRASTNIFGTINQSSDTGALGLAFNANDGNASTPGFVWRTGTDGSTFTERMRLTSTGLGIGTTNPVDKLSVANGGIVLTQSYGITWNNGDNYIKGVSGYHVDVTTYDGSSAQQDGIRVVGGVSKSARLITHGGIRYGRAIQSAAANKVIRGWHNYTVSGSSGATNYIHFKTNMWAGGSPHGNIHYTMSLFRATGYSYNAQTIDSLLGFHNWSGTHYSIAITNLGSKAFWQNPYTSSDGYTVLVGNLGSYNYDAISIDWFQVYEYPFVDGWVTNQTITSSSTGAY